MILSEKEDNSNDYDAQLNKFQRTTAGTIEIGLLAKKRKRS